MTGKKTYQTKLSFSLLTGTNLSLVFNKKTNRSGNFFFLKILSILILFLSILNFVLLLQAPGAISLVVTEILFFSICGFLISVVFVNKQSFPIFFYRKLPHSPKKQTFLDWKYCRMINLKISWICFFCKKTTRRSVL